MSSTGIFFVDFCIGYLDGKVQSDIVIRSNNARQYSVDLES